MHPPSRSSRCGPRVSSRKRASGHIDRHPADRIDRLVSRRRLGSVTAGRAHLRLGVARARPGSRRRSPRCRPAPGPSPAGAWTRARLVVRYARGRAGIRARTPPACETPPSRCRPPASRAPAEGVLVVVTLRRDDDHRSSVPPAASGRASDRRRATPVRGEASASSTPNATRAGAPARRASRRRASDRSRSICGEGSTGSTYTSSAPSL